MAVRLFFAGLIVLLVFLGCGGGGGGGGGGTGTGVLPVTPVVVSGTLSGTIAIDQTITALRPDISSFSPSLRFLDSFVFIEELPNLSTRADQDGKFVFENVPFGTYRIIARVTSLSGRKYKLRTTAQSLSQSDPQKSVTMTVTPPDLAENQIRMLIKDLNDNPIGKCKVWFWGEQFTMDENGYYLSPEMPAAAAGTIKVEPPVGKDLSGLTFDIPATTFNPDNVEIVGITLPTAGITNKAPIVSITTDKYPEGGSAFLRLFGNYSDPEGEPMQTSWLTNVSTFTFIAKDYADWAVPSVSASVTVYFSASEDGRYYPRLTSTANLSINVASSGEVSFPGEILLRPVTRSVDIAGSSTTQISGNTVAQYEAVPDFPPGLALTYNWTADRGTILSSATEKIMSWRSPTLSPGQIQVASITVSVTDGIGTATKEIQVRVTSAPTVTITKPTAGAFESGLIVFTGSARDYLNTTISPDSMRWYVATGSEPFVAGQTGGATFTWQFLTQGSYTVALTAFDANSVVGTGTKEISIINGRPLCSITTPLDDASFRENTPVTFTGEANDLEDGAITDATRLVWTSDIDGIIGSGTTFTVATMTSSRHEIRFSATDSGGAVGSTSIVIWYDVPARISFTPADRSVFFAGYDIPFSAVGTDTDNTPLDSSQFEWYIDDSPDIWRDGASFTVSAGAYTPGAHRIYVKGSAKFETASSPTHVIQMGWPVASITSPASGTRFEPLDVVSFTAFPDSTGTLSLEWYLNNETTSFGSGAVVNYAPSNGAHQVTYIGTDSQGIVSSSTINIVVERVPIVSFFPLTGSYFFTGHPVDFTATCLDSDNNDIDDDRVSWLFNGMSWVAVSGKTFSLNQPGELAAGTHDITLIATGPYGTAGAITNTINAGVPAAVIISPATNETFLPGADINFSGTPDSTGTIDMEWWANYGDAGAIKIGDGATVATNSLPEGYHLITYLGTDSSNFVSSASRRIGVGQFPEMDFSPDDGTVFFGSQNVVFTGVGTDSIDGMIPGSRMKWFIDGVEMVDFTGYSIMTLTPVVMTGLGEGLKIVELHGTNTIGAVGVTTKQIYLGVPDLEITSPSYDTVIPLSTLYTFTGLPDSITGTGITEDLEMHWLLNGASLSTTGATLTYTVPGGIHYITYIGTDSRGLEMSDTIRVIVSDDPTVTFSPAPNSAIFTGKPFTLEASGDVATETVEWSLDGGATVWKTGSPEVVTAGELSTGLYDITAIGTNTVGVVASRTNENIYYGHPLLTIASPASGITVARSALALTFEGSPANASSSITILWQHSDRTATSPVGTTINNSITLVDGWNDITLTGTDIAGNQCVSSVSVLRNDPPDLEITPGDNSIFFAGRTVTFTGSGTSSVSGTAVAGSTMKWTISDGTDITATSTASYPVLKQEPLYPSLRSITLEATDDLGTSNTFGPIEVAFGYPLASITAPASGDRYDLGDSITFSGYPNDGAISMEWYRDAEAVPFHTGANPPAQSGWPAGMRTVRYQGTDASGFVSSATIQILINDQPSVALWQPVLSPPGNNLVFFAGRPTNLTATGTTSSGNDVATFSWYVNGSASPNYSGVSITIPANTLSVAASPHSIRLEATDEYGVKNEVTFNISFCSLPVITNPTAGQRFASGSSVLLEGSPDTMTNLTMEWWYDYASGGALLGAGTPFNSAVDAIPYGSRTITYLATDSSGFVASASRQIILSSDPTMAINPNAGVFFNRAVVLSGSGTSAIGEPIASSTFKWYVDDVERTALRGQASPTFNVADITAGERKITLSGEDVYGTLADVDVTCWFRYDNPSITSPSNGATIDHGLPVTLSGQPDSYIPYIHMQWYDNGAVIGNGGTITETFGRGLHTIEYSATDSGNVGATATIQLVANTPPTVDFLPSGVPRYFVERNVTLYGYGSNTAAIPESISTFSWKIVNSKGTFTYSGASPEINYANLSAWPLLNEITVYGTDDLGTIGTSTTRTVVYGITLASVTAPVNGSVYSSLGNTINCGAIPKESSPELTTQWYLNGTAIATGTNVDSITFTNLPIASYTIRYVASDSSGYISSYSVTITVNDTPSLEILPDNENAALSPFYFVSQPVVLTGSGTSQAGDTIDPVGNMKWYVGGSLRYTGSPADLTAYLSPGLNTVRLTATDTLNEPAEVTSSVLCGVSNISISSPSPGTTFSTADALAGLSFSGSSPPAAPHTFTPAWHHESGPGSPRSWTGASLTGISFAAGTHTIRYLATDSSDFVSSATLSILVNNEPDLEIIPGPDSIFFVGRPIDLEASGTSNPGEVAISDGARMQWYVNGTDRGTGMTKQLQTTWLNNGNNTVTLVGTDDLGTVGTYSQTIYYGYAEPSITKPASGSVFLSTESIDFEATPASLLSATPEWWIDGVKVSSVPSFTSPALSAGIRVIQYIATDSSFDATGYIASDTIDIQVRNKPQMTFSPASDSYFFAGNDVTFTGVGTDSDGIAIDAADMKWYLNTDPVPHNGSPYTVIALQFDPGPNKLLLQGTDNYGVTGEVLGENLTYGLSNVSITTPVMNSVFPSATTDVYFESTPNLAPFGITGNWYHIAGSGSNPAVAYPGSSTVITFAAGSGLHTIKYLATDSANNISSATVDILISDAPTVTFVNPAANSVFFAGENFTLEADGTGAIAPFTAIDSADFTWYRDSVTTQFKTGKTAVVNAEDVTVGEHSFYVTGVDDNGLVGTSTTKTMFYGHPALTIASPASDIWIDSIAPTTRDFLGSTASPAIALTVQWYLDGSPVGAVGANPVSITFPASGQYKIEYAGADDAGNVSTATVNVLIRTVPAMSIDSPASGSHLFTVAGNQVEFTGSGVDMASMTWQLDAQAPQSNVNPITFSGLSTGWHTVKLTGTYEPGVTSYTTSMFYYGHPALSIVSPLNNDLIASDSPPANVLFTGSSIMTPATISLVWYYKSAPYSAGNTTWNPTGASFDSGYNYVYYEGTDAAGTVSTATVVIRKRDEPEMVISTGTALTAGADYYFFTGSPVTFTGSGLDVDAASMSWYLAGSLSYASTDTANYASIAVGNQTLRLDGTDSYGLASTTSIEVHGIAQAAISQPLAQRYDIGNIDLSGTPDSIGAITMKWYRDYGTASQTWLADGAGLHTVNLPVAQRGYRPITYIGTDSYGFVSSKTVQILLNDPPTMSIASPTAGGKYFGGQSLYFEGSGQNSASPADPISAASMTWYFGATTVPGVDNFFATPGQLGTGPLTIRLEGRDEYNTVGSVSIDITSGLSLPTIASPASGIRFSQGGAAVDFTGSADNTGNMRWFCDAAPIAYGSTISFDPTLYLRGLHTITYIGTDSADTARSASISVLIDDPPTMTITKPASSPAYFFGGQDIEFIGTGQTSQPAAITEAASLTWYSAGSTVLGNGLNITAQISDLPPNTYNIRFEGKDEFGIIGSVTHPIETGISLPKITYPASGTRFDLNQLATFTGTPDLAGKIPMEWHWLEGPGAPEVIGVGSTTQISTLDRGWQTISYIGMDSALTVASDTIQILVNSPPVFTQPASISSLVFAEGPFIGGASIPIALVSSDSRSISFIVDADDCEGNPMNEPGSYSWTLKGTTTSGHGDDKNKTLNFETTGSYTISVAVTDQYNQTATSSLTFWVWETEDYPLDVATFTGICKPSTIARNGVDTRITVLVEENPPNANDETILVSLERKTTGLTTSGDLTNVIASITVASVTPYVIQEFTLADKLYTIASHSGSPASEHYKIQAWNLNTLAQTDVAPGYQYHGYDFGTASSQFSIPQGIAVKNGEAIFVADTGNNKLKKLDLNNGAFYSVSQNTQTPLCTRLIGTKLLVAAKGSNQISQFQSDLNSTADWSSDLTQGATQFVVGASGNIYVTDPAGCKVHVISSTGAYLYWFGVSGTGLGEFQKPYGITLSNAAPYDMYITDRSGDKIIRFRSNAW